MSLFKRKRARKQEHEEIEGKLAEKERELEEYERRVRVLRLEVGVFRPRPGRR